MDISPYCRHLKQKDGIWYAERNAYVSYPHEGNEFYFQIEDNSFWFRHRNNCIAEAVKKFPPSGLFFDIGGGNGYVSKGIQDIGFETVLVEPDEQGCLNARTRNIKNIICATIEDAGFDPGSIPAIGVFDVVEHFENDLGILGTISKYLQKNGLVYITVPAYNLLWSKDDDYLGHFNRYTIASLTGQLNKVGLGVVYATYIFSILPLPIFLFRTIPGKLGISKSPSDAGNKNKEHKHDNPILKKVWDWELNRIRANKTIGFGGTCLVVARKL